MHDTGPDDPRLDLLRHWLEHGLGWLDSGLAPASADASFRRYFRVTRPDGTYVAMDAPPDKEDVEPYLKSPACWRTSASMRRGCWRATPTDGFLLLTDLGSTTYLAELANRARAGDLYRDAIDALVRIQSGGAQHAGRLPPYDEKLLRFEMSLFPDWLLGRHLDLQLDESERGQLSGAFDSLVAAALEQPRVFVHRDYHSRNLMVCAGPNPGVLDFQDAVHGPLTYDLVSLLRDCYVAWPQEQRRRVGARVPAPGLRSWTPGRHR